MTPLPAALGIGDVVAWRLDKKIREKLWDSGVGARKFGGRWNSRDSGFVVYCAIDPATAILEVIVHKGIAVLDAVPHVMSSLVVDKAALARIHVVHPSHVPNQNWLRSGSPSASQQAFGDNLLAKHEFVLVPSVVSKNSWNLLFERSRAAGLYTPGPQEHFALDTRLNSLEPNGGVRPVF